MTFLAKFETAADDWWDRLNNDERKTYVQAHPRSKYAHDWHRNEQTAPAPANQPAKRIPKVEFTEDFLKALHATPGAEIVPEGIKLEVSRYQKLRQEGGISVRTGVFFIPTATSFSADRNYRAAKGTIPWYGGDRKYRGQRVLKAPMIVKSDTGGEAPQTAYEQLKGEGSYETIMQETGKLYQISRKYHKKMLIHKVRSLLKKYGGSYSMAEFIIDNSRHGNTLTFNITENIVASTLRRAGYDSLLAYKRGRLTELFSLNDRRYPVIEEASAHDSLEWSHWVFKTPFEHTAALAADWWDRLNHEEQQAYIKAHPHTKMVNQVGVNKSVPPEHKPAPSASPIKKADLDDALGVLKEWSSVSNIRWMGASIDQVFNDALAKAKVENIPIETGKFNYFHDWGRRPKSDNPIITLRQPDGTQYILDGQHRYLTHKDQGAKLISTLALDIPLKRIGGKLIYYPNLKRGSENE